NLALMIDSYSSIKGNLVDKKIRALASSGSVRSESTPDIPTLRESGVADYDVVSWNALFAPAGTAPEIVKTLNQALQEILGHDDVRKRLLTSASPRISRSEEHTSELQSHLNLVCRLLLEKKKKKTK